MGCGFMDVIGGVDISNISGVVGTKSDQAEPPYENNEKIPEYILGDDNSNKMKTPIIQRVLASHMAFC